MEHILWSEDYLEVGTDAEIELKYHDKEAEGEQRKVWETQAYPLGNGRLGCTLFGDPKRERVQFNEESLWVGNEECTGAYQPFGDVIIDVDAGCGDRDAGSGIRDENPRYANYRRELDIARAVQTVSYESNGVNYKRECFISSPAQVLVLRLTADRPGVLSGKVQMKSLQPVEVTAADSTITMTGNTGDLWYWRLMEREPARLWGSREFCSDNNIDQDFEARLRVLSMGGSLETSDSVVAFDGCDSVTVLLGAATSFLNEREKGWRGEDPHERISRQVEAAAGRSFDELLGEHVSDFKAIYGRVVLDLGATPAEIAGLSTPERVAQYGEDYRSSGGSDDRGLEVLLYQYARYLMICSSRPEDVVLPTNLQGIWLFNKHPSWRCDFHTDINIQMNYWFTDAANIGECYLPFAQWVDSIREVRKEETERVLGVKRGWLMRSENGLYGGSTWHIQKGDSAWLCQNLWEHFAFTRDKAFLERYAYPVMKEISEFWVDHLKERSDGILVVPEGRSPEHGPVGVDGVTYDQVLCWDLFNNTIEASGELGIDEEFRSELKEKRDRLLGPQIGKWGQLQEWMEDIDDPEDDHRHINHLICVYPGRQVHPAIDSAMAEAARVGLTARRDHGEEHPGWSRVWKSCIFGRLGRGDDAHNELACMMSKKLYSNMWTTHPPFQIDANFGYAAGVHEMLAQSHLTVGEVSGDGCQTGESDNEAECGASYGEEREKGARIIHLLPALPKAWPSGRIKGMRLRGGYELDMSWQDGRLTEAAIGGVSNDKDELEVRYEGASRFVSVGKGESVSLDFS